MIVMIVYSQSIVLSSFYYSLLFSYHTRRINSCEIQTYKIMKNHEKLIELNKKLILNNTENNIYNQHNRTNGYFKNE